MQIILKEKDFNFTFVCKFDKGANFWLLSKSTGSNMHQTTQVCTFKIKLLLRAIKYTR
jgi:hypothetical protein